MTSEAPYTPGAAVQFWDLHLKDWRIGQYVGPARADYSNVGRFHVVQPRRGQPRPVSANWVRPVPSQHRLAGHIAVMQREDGTSVILGPAPSAAAAAALAAEFFNIYGAPLAILDLTPRKIDFTTGDGITGNQKDKK